MASMRRTLALQRTSRGREKITRDDHSAQRIHDAPVALNFRGNVEVLGEDEVQVPLERMAEDDRVGVAVFREKAL
jgi:hypothetical protein